ncbi:ATP-binding protein [Streptomyces sp. NPDC059385]|uniref:sensor histidine kinase n=1 Tax=Streptomyces sp. NPDC059385 TaxID=3346817 RepID=UPI003676AC65
MTVGTNSSPGATGAAGAADAATERFRGASEAPAAAHELRGVPPQAAGRARDRAQPPAAPVPAAAARIGVPARAAAGSGPGSARAAHEPRDTGDAKDVRGTRDARDSHGERGDEGHGFGVDPDELPDGLVVADDTGRVICFNRAAARITDIAAHEALGTRIDRALPLEDLEGRRWWALTDPYGGLATRRGQPERNLLLPGGREVLVSASYVRTHPTGPLRRLVVTLRGTEARRRTERSHAELIATVAHELRSPLTSVKGFTATLLAKWERFTDDQKRLMLETVDADANRVTRLIAELLDISRIDSGRLEVRRQPVDIATAVGRHVQALTANGQEPERFLVSVSRPLPDLWADPDKIDQILGNLLENAVRHGEGTVTIDVMPHEKGTAVTVTDEGPGIPEESMSRVFTRFWRGSKRGGTGLGLYIVKGIVEAHGGTITVGRGPGGGAEFRFILPVSAPAYLTQ